MYEPNQIPLPPKIQMAGALGSRFRGTSSGDVRQDVESQSTAAIQSTVNSRASRSWKQVLNNPRESGVGGGEAGGRGNGGGFGEHGAVEAEVDEGEPLLCEEVIRMSTFISVKNRFITLGRLLERIRFKERSAGTPVFRFSELHDLFSWRLNAR